MIILENSFFLFFMEKEEVFLWAKRPGTSCEFLEVKSKSCLFLLTNLNLFVCLIMLTIFIWLAGAALRWYGVIQYKNSDISRIAIGLLVDRTIILFICIPLTCANLKKK